jgi:hypothetical protein
MPTTDFAPHSRAARDHRPSWLAMSRTLAPSRMSRFSEKIPSKRRFSRARVAAVLLVL